MPTLVQRALSFAHLAGLTPSLAVPKKAEDEEDKEKKEQDRENGDSKAEDEEKDTAAEGYEPKDGEEDDKDEEEDEEDKEKAKKAKAEDKGDEDEEEKKEMSGNSAAASARRRERARCAAILASPLAARNVALAAHLAFNTTMTSAEAIAALQNVPVTNRAERNPHLGAGGEMASNSKAAISQSWEAAFAKHRKK